MPSEDTQFKPGWEGGPGRPKLKDEEKRVRELLRNEIAKVAEVLTASYENANEILQDKDKSLLHQVLAKMLKKNDFNAIDKTFLSRMLGMPKQTIENTNIDINLDNELTEEHKRDIAKAYLAEKEWA